MITNLKCMILSVRGPYEQNHLADELGINRGRLSQYCTGIRKIPIHHLMKLSGALGCSPRDLVGFRELESA